MAYIRRAIITSPPPSCSHILHIQFTGTASHTKAATQTLTLRLTCGLIIADTLNARNQHILAAPTATTSGRGASAIERQDKRLLCRDKERADRRRIGF
ncbi:hypothetical protein DPMN_188197 [Dreissena polymorpha]|uniref:Uncharacterized protein n=1 Tax=Dreissena polymorpha TaxID=45954 RepID=A0A9D4DPN6_DREPO|nr:hypothetical protein DPMN_188197 [Dreissena polymorpha]